MIERLPEERFDDLKKVHDGFVPDPKNSVVLVAMEGGHYIGRVFLMAPAHVEGPWVREDRRSNGLGTSLMHAVEDTAKALGIRELFAYGADDYLESQLRRLGYQKQRLTVWK